MKTKIGPLSPIYLYLFRICLIFLILIVEKEKNDLTYIYIYIYKYIHIYVYIYIKGERENIFMELNSFTIYKSLDICETRVDPLLEAASQGDYTEFSMSE